MRLTALPSPLVVDTFDGGDPLRNALALGHWTGGVGGSVVGSEVAGDAQPLLPQVYLGDGSHRASVALGDYVTLTAEGGAAEQLVVNLRVTALTPTKRTWLPQLHR